MVSLRIWAAVALTLTLSSSGWAEIYETKDADGSTSFTDTPPEGSSTVITLPHTNLVDTVQPAQNTKYEATAEPQQNLNTNDAALINSTNAAIKEERLKMLQDYERRHSATPYEVGDSDAQMPHQVGDSDAQMPHQVGDSDAQMPHQVGDSDAQMPHQVGDSDAQMPHEVGDFSDNTAQDYEGYIDARPTEAQRVHKVNKQR